MNVLAAPGHNVDFYRKWIIADVTFSRLIFKNVNCLPFQGTFDSSTIPSSVKIACRVRYHMMDPNTEQAKYDALALGELLAPVLAAGKFLPMEEARNELVRIVRYMISNPPVDTTYYTAPVWANWRGFLTAAHLMTTVPEGWANLEVHPNDAMIQQLDAPTAAIILAWFGRTSPLFGVQNAVEMITTVILATVKQGNVTGHVITKIQRDLEVHLGVNLELDAEVIKVYHAHFSGALNQDNADPIFNVWKTWIPESALRLSLMIQQASMAGLTAFCVTGKAIRVYADFRWDQVANILQVEWEAFHAAIQAVNGNPYYGFSKDLGAAKSTNYKSVTWVAKELLIRIDGNTTLKKYKGWIARPKHAETLQSLVDNYVTEVEQRLQEALPRELVAPDNCMLLARSQNYANMFA